MSNIADQPAIQSNPTQTGSHLVDPKISGQRPYFMAGTDRGLLLLNPEPQTELEGYAITALASSGKEWWAISDHHSIWQRSAEGQWHRVALVSDLKLHCLLPLQDTLLVGTSSACLIRVKDGDLQRINCFESVEGSDEWYTPWGAPPDVRSLAVSPAGTLYVNVHVGGILRSEDQGQTWQPTIDFHADVHEVRTLAGRPDWVLAATAQGLASSEDRGNNWRFDRENLHGAYARAIEICGETILMTASTGPHTGKAAIYRRPLEQPGRFEKCEQGLPEWFPSNINTGTLTTAGDFAAFGTREGEIFLSLDAGQSWQPVATGLAPIQCLAMVQ
jgi:hypothetical protein